MRLKNVVLAAARSTGLFSLVRDSRWRRRRLLILCYHGVSIDDEHEWNPELYISQEQLRRRLRALRDGGYQVLTLADATRRLYDGTLPPRSVALTFDDGAFDFEQRALPVLREFNAPATVYLTTYYCGTRLPVFDTMLSYVLWKGRHGSHDVASLCHARDPLPISTPEQRKRAWKELREFADAGALSAVDKDGLLSRLADLVRVDYASLRARQLLHIMSEDTVRALPRDLIDVQLHTHRHRAPRDRELFLREITDNASVIRQLRGERSPLEHFCYPSGEYFGEFLGWLGECDVRFATTCLPDLSSEHTHPLLLPRFVDTSFHSDVLFDAWASGFAALLPRRRRYRPDAVRLAAETHLLSERMVEQERIA